MEAIIIIEVSDQHGKIVERYRTPKLPIRIGRAYDNDLIVDDPYVCPHHCEVVLNEAGEIVVNDLSSVNGTYAMADGSRSGQFPVDADSRLRIGHTMLHFKLPDQAVEATRFDHTPLHQKGEWPPRLLSFNIAVLLLGALVMTAKEYLGSYNMFEYWRYFFSQQIPALLAVAGWAAVWSIISRVTAHRFSFFRHATILVSILLAITMSDYLLDFLKFGFASQGPFEVISIGLSMVAIALLLFWHLRLCSDQSRSRLMMGASAFAVVFVSLVQINDYLDSQEFHRSPLYPTNLKPPAFQIVKSEPVDDFLMKSEQIRKKIDQEIEVLPTAEHSQGVVATRPEK